MYNIFQSYIFSLNFSFFYIVKMIGKLIVVNCLKFSHPRMKGSVFDHKRRAHILFGFHHCPHSFFLMSFSYMLAEKIIELHLYHLFSHFSV